MAQNWVLAMLNKDTISTNKKLHNCPEVAEMAKEFEKIHELQFKIDKLGQVKPVDIPEIRKVMEEAKADIKVNIESILCGIAFYWFCSCGVVG